jgi:AcrR family transcriptional regulator
MRVEGDTSPEGPAIDVEPGARPGSTREHILAAAEQAIMDLGLAGATTKAIAERAGCAEGSIYRYFQDKHALYHELVRTRFPAFLDLMASLPARAGKSSLRRTLEEVAASALTFYRAILPLVGGAMASRQLLEEQRLHFHEHEMGPMKVVGSLSTYLRSEQQLGRVAERVSVEHASRLLLGACFTQAYLEILLGSDAPQWTNEQFARETVRSLAEGIRPREPRMPVLKDGG